MTLHRHTSRILALAIVLLGLTGMPSTARAQTTVPSQTTSPVVDQTRGLTVDQIVALALERSPRLAAVRRQADVARGEQMQASLRTDPSLNVNQREQLRGSDRQTAIDVSVPLELFRIGARETVADRQVAVASAEVDRAAWDLAASVRLQAGIVLSAQRRLEVTGRQIVAARELRDLVAASVTAGALPRLDRDIADVDLKRLEAAERVARGDVDAAIAAIKGLAGLAQTEPLVFRPIDVEVAASVMDTGSKLEAMRTDPSKRPDVAVSNAQLALLSAQTNLARQDARWNLQLTGGYMRTDMSFPQLGLTFDGRPEPIGARFHELQFGATLAIPWRNRNQGAIAAAVARESATTAERDAVAQEADAGLAAARARWVAGREAAALFSTDLLSLARQNVDVVQQTYLAGRGTLNDVLVERRRLLELEMDYTNLLAALLAADVELRKAMGVIR